jgi:hypothetical protein
MWSRMGQRHVSARGLTRHEGGGRCSARTSRRGSHRGHQTTVRFDAWRKSLETRYLNAVQTHL